MSNYDSDDDEEVAEIGFHSASIGGNSNSNQIWASSSSSDDYGRPSAPPPASSTLIPTSPSRRGGNGTVSWSLILPQRAGRDAVDGVVTAHEGVEIAAVKQAAKRRVKHTQPARIGPERGHNHPVA